MNDDADNEQESEPEPGLPRSLQTVSMSQLLTYAAVSIALMSFLLTRDYGGLGVLVAVVIAGLVCGMSLAGAAIRWNWQRHR